MPVQKFRSIEEMGEPPACEPGTPEHCARVRALWHRASRLARPVYPCGVFRFRSIEEAQEARERASAEKAGSPAADRNASNKAESGTARS
jgi:hypothetical protein